MYTIYNMYGTDPHIATILALRRVRCGPWTRCTYSFTDCRTGRQYMYINNTAIVAVLQSMVYTRV